jgi:formate dehydrogenase subunit delta
MDTDKLVHMANQIASFFRAYPEDEARAGIHEHIQSSWTPPMREAILGDLRHAGLDPLVVAALERAPRVR